MEKLNPKSKSKIAKKIIKIEHHLDDYECMWNGIEDLYIDATKEKIPDQFFFAMSGFCGFAYIKTNNSDLKRLVSFGEGRTKQMYNFLAPIVGFEYRHIECRSPELALERFKKEINAGYPVVIGALDMYYLKYYPKLYFKEHIPFHYVLGIGYGDDAQKVYLYDCGRKAIQELTYSDLFLAMNASYPGLSKANTICTIRMTNPNKKQYIIKKALLAKVKDYCEPPTSFLGINGIKKICEEFPSWERELGKEETKKIIKNMLYFFGSVPGYPNKLLGINQKDSIAFMCSRDKMSKVLIELGNEYRCDYFFDASNHFLESGKFFEQLKELFVDYLLLGKDCTKEVVEILSTIGDIEYEAYRLIEYGVKTNYWLSK